MVTPISMNGTVTALGAGAFFRVTAGRTLTLTCDAYSSARVEWSNGTDQDVFTGVATWITWPNGTISGASSSDVIRGDIWCRVYLVSGTASWVISNGAAPFAATRTAWAAGHAAEHAAMGLVDITSVIADDPTKGAANTTAINAAISVGGAFSITKPGVIYISSTLRLHSFTSIFVGANTTIRSVAGLAFPTMENYNYASPAAATLSAGELTYNSTTMVATLAHTGIGASFPLNSYIAVIGSSTTWSCGVFGPVTVSSANSISWVFPRTPSATPAVGTITVFNVDNDIRIWGPGTIDPNYLGTTSNANPLTNAGTRWFKTANLTIDVANIQEARGFANSICCFLNFSTTGTVIFANIQAGNDPFHISSPGRGVRVRRLKTTAADNSVGLLALGLSATSTVAAEPVWCGELDDIDIDGVETQTTSSSVVGMWGDVSSKFGSVKINNLSGCAQWGVTVNTFALGGANWASVNGDRLEVSNINLTLPVGGTALYMGCAGNWDYVSATRFTLPGPGIFYQLYQAPGNTVKTLVIERLSSPIVRTEDVIKFTGGASITNLFTNDITIATAGGAYGFITSQAQITNYSFTNLNLTNTGTGRFIYQTGYFLYHVLGTNLNLYGNFGYVGGLSFLKTDASAAPTTKDISITNTYAVIIDSLIQLPHAQTASTNINLVNITMAACLSCVRSSAPTDIVASNVYDLSPAGDPLFTHLTTGKAYSVSSSNCVSALGILVKPVAAGALLRVTGGSSMKMDGDQFTGTAVAGDSFWNTNSTSTFGSGTSKIGQYGYTGAAWTKLFGPA